MFDILRKLGESIGIYSDEIYKIALKNKILDTNPSPNDNRELRFIKVPYNEDNLTFVENAENEDFYRI